MGNAIVSDDKVGLLIVNKIAEKAKNPHVEVKTTEAGGLYILDVMMGFDFAIVVDAIKTGKHEPGAIIQFNPGEFDFTPRGTMVHDVSFFDAIELGKKMDIKVPGRIEIVSIEIIDNRTVSENINEEVMKAVDPAIEKVVSLASDMGFDLYC